MRKKKYHVENEGIRKKLWWGAVQFQDDLEVFYKRLRGRDIICGRWGSLYSVVIYDGEWSESTDANHIRFSLTQNKALQVVKAYMPKPLKREQNPCHNKKNFFTRYDRKDKRISRYEYGLKAWRKMCREDERISKKNNRMFHKLDSINSMK